MARTARGPAVKLNIGCGDKILPGYTNIDAVDRAGHSPDIVADIRAIPLPDGCASEVLAVHVIEHFYRWEADAVVAEWVRLLKPGGKLVLECPDLAHACHAFLSGAPDPWSMWVFYGDPAWKDPLMCHRWGYTPETLGRLMESAGLERVQREPAMFKMREPRDMRMVGYCPY